MDDNMVDIWEELDIVERKDEVMEWGKTTWPHLMKNETIIAQLWYKEQGRDIPTPIETITVDDLKNKFADFKPEKKPDGKMTKLYANIEVVMVQPLEDKIGYFGCPKCYNKVNKVTKICTNYDLETGHDGEEVEGKMMYFQKWQAGDSTGNIIVTFGPGKHQDIEMVANTVILKGSMNSRDGSFSVWEIARVIKPKMMKAKPLKKMKKKEPEPEPEPEPVVEPEEVEEDEPEDEEEYGSEIFEESEDTDEATEESGIAGGWRDNLPDGSDARLMKAFKKVLKKHFAEANPYKNLVSWASVQPDFRNWEKGPERDEIVKVFLQEMVDEGYFKFTDKAKTHIQMMEE